MARAELSKSFGRGFESHRERHSVLKGVYEPLYKLNQRDEARFRALALREAADGQVPKYPALTPAEHQELERLSRKQTRKLWSHPRMQVVRQEQRTRLARIRRLVRKLEALLPPLKSGRK